MKENLFKLEKSLLKQGYSFIIGIDEAGRGPLAGPVVACAASWRCHPEFISGSQKSKNRILKQVQHDKRFELIKDSKLLSEKQREELYDFIHEYFYVGIGICDHKAIDRVNILNATYLAMKIAIGDLLKKSKIKNQNAKLQFKMQNYKSNDDRYIILVDGNKTISNLSIEQKAIVNGDKLVKSISAASIVAKVTRDRIMIKMHKKYSQYGFAQHKGYGTKLHQEMLKKHGPCEIHRKSFKPCTRRKKQEERSKK